MYELIFITPAINRPEIHSMCFIPIINNLKIKILWIINIDYISHYNISINQTINNLNSIKTDYIDFKIISSVNPCFFNAVKNLVLETNKILIENTNIKGILYLEDDWLINNENINLFNQQLITITDNTIINFAYNSDKKLNISLISFKPTLWSIDIFEKTFMKIFMESNKIDDPEKYLKDEFIRRNINIGGIYIKHYLIFEDIGREWLKNKNINLCKWDKHQENGTITYKKQYHICILTIIIENIEDKINIFDNFYNTIKSIPILWIVVIPPNRNDLYKFFSEKKTDNIDINIHISSSNQFTKNITQLILICYKYLNYIKYSIIYLDNRIKSLNDNSLCSYYKIDDKILSLCNCEPYYVITNLLPSIWSVNIYKKTLHKIFKKELIDINLYKSQVLERINTIKPNIKLKSIPIFNL